MQTLSTMVLAGIGAGLFATGGLLAWLAVVLRSRHAHVPASLHRAELVAQRRRFRHRLRTVRDELQRARANDAELRKEIRIAGEHQATQERLLASARAEAAGLRARVGDLERTDSSRAPELLRLKAREQALREELRQSQERLAGLDREQSLLRIEREEVEAHTHRLRALGTPSGAANESGRIAVAPATRTELADRDARIHELQCELRESAGRVEQLETDLRTWKYRIAPLALHMKLRRAQTGESTGIRPSLRSNDELQRIRGISRALEKKLRAVGITEFAQLAGMSPAELANLAVKVGVAASRPQRDQWAEQAQELCAASAVAAQAEPAQAETA